MPFHSIDHPADPRIEPYRNMRERDLVGRRGLFIAEGKVVLRTLLDSPVSRPVSLLIAENRLASMRDILGKVAAETPIYVARRDVMDMIVGFPIHRGILALGQRTEDTAPDTLLSALPRKARAVMLSAIANHDNMGGIFRNAAAFGVDCILLDSGCCDPLYRKSIRVSVGAALRVPFARLEPGQDGLALLAHHGFIVLALTPGGTMTLDQVPAHPRSALLLGAEGPGLAAELLARAQKVRIEMAPGMDSLNVATASGIALHYLQAMRAT